ncbi:TniQ family protein [Streptomyces bobili]|uniref:TniQ family protein n=1 Tax=Streptomyces bobili TaxID=67280 RepID=UPI0033A6894B
MLPAMTLQPFDGHAVDILPRHRRVNRWVLWGRAGSRFCPFCLADSGGRWLVAWRLSWSFACTRHHVLLVDRCPACHRVPRLRSHPGGRHPVRDGAPALPRTADHGHLAATTPSPTPRPPRFRPMGTWPRPNASSTPPSPPPAVRCTGRCTVRTAHR